MSTIDPITNKPYRCPTCGTTEADLERGRWFSAARCPAICPNCGPVDVQIGIREIDLPGALTDTDRALQFLADYDVAVGHTSLTERACYTDEGFCFDPLGDAFPA